MWRRYAGLPILGKQLIGWPQAVEVVGIDWQHASSLGREALLHRYTDYSYRPIGLIL